MRFSSRSPLWWLPVLSDAEVEALTRRYQLALKRIGERTNLTLKRIWDALGSWDEADILGFFEQIEPALAAAKKSTVRVSNGYYSKLGEVRPPAFPVADVLSVPPDPATPFLSHWSKLKNGVSFAESVESAFADMSNDVVDFVQSTARRTADVTAANGGVKIVGWRRVLTGVSCEWCALVSTQRYRSAESADFGHRACDCSVVAIVGDRDPGQVINSKLYDRLQESNVSNRLSQGRASKRSLVAADNAIARRDQALAELSGEADPQRRMRLESRARRWDRKASAYKVQAAEQTAHVEALKPIGTTGYVTADGVPAPTPNSQG